MKRLALAVCALAAPAAACARDAVLITLEAVRADRLGARRAGESLTPALDALGARGAIYEAAYAQAPWTIPSLASLLTSTYAEQHRAVLPGPRLDPGAPTLASALGRAGWRTAAFVAGAPTDEGVGLTASFQTVGRFGTKTPDIETLVDAAARFIAEPDPRPFFVWIHAFNTHLPYMCPSSRRERYASGRRGAVHSLGPALDPLDLASASLADVSKLVYHFNGHAETGLVTPHYPRDLALEARVAELRSNGQDLAHLTAHYEGCLRWSDEQIARLDRHVAARPGGEGVLWAVTSDHGEYLGRAAWTDEPRISHPFADLHEELLRVPLVLAGPGLPRGRVREPVELVDLAPTLLAALGVPPPPEMRGADLAARDARVGRGVYASDRDPDAGRWSRALRGGAFKILRSTGAWSLFDLARDPRERADVSREDPEAFLRSARELLEHDARASEQGPAVDPEALSLEIALDPRAGRFEASVRHRLRARRGFDRVELAARGLTIRKAADGEGRALRFAASTSSVVVFLSTPAQTGASVALRLDYEGRGRHAGLHMFASDPRYPGRPDAAWSHGQPDLTPYWIPVVDHPSQRAATEVVARVPEGFSAVSNGVLVSSGPGGVAGTVVWRWRQSRPHPVHLVALYVGRYEVARATGAAVPIAYWVPPGRAADAAATFAKTPRMLDFFARETGVRYPWDRYDVAIIHGSRFGGMENTSALALREDFLLDAEAALDGDVDGPLAHELAHQWYGDLLSARSWDQAWIIEALPSYMQALWTERDRGRDAFEHDLDVKARRYFREARERPRALSGAESRAPQELFDAHAYDKGAWLLHMLRRRAGDDVFRAALRDFTARRADAAAGVGDLRAALERAGVRGLEGFFAQWAARAGHPRLRVELSWDERASEAVLRVVQAQAVDGGPLFRVPLEVAFAGARPERATLVLSSAETSARVRLDRRPSFVRLDPDLALLAEYELKAPIDMLVAQLGSDPSAAGRLGAARALGDSGVPEAAGALGRCALADAHWGPAAACAEALGGLARAEPGRTAALAAVLDAQRAPDARVRRAAAVSLGLFVGSAAALEALANAASSDPSRRVRAAALEAAGALGLARAEEILARALDSEPSLEARRGALAGLGRLKSAGARSLVERWSGPGRPAVLRAAALVALAAIGGPGALPRLLSVVAREDDRLVLSAAVSALRVLGDPRGAPALRRLASRDPEPEMRRLARAAAQALSRR